MDKREAERAAERRIKRAMEKKWRASRAERRRPGAREYVVEVRSTSEGTTFTRRKVTR